MKARHFCSKVLRRTFPAQMQVHDLKIVHNNSLKELERLRSLSENEIIEMQIEQYEKAIGHEPNLEKPQSFTEKIQWRKLYDRDPVYSELSDKYRVRDWVTKKIGGEYLIPLLGVWDDPHKINFKRLPDQFVLKTNNAAGTNTIVTDKAIINKSVIVENYNYWLKYPYGYQSFEFHYNSIKPLIIAEKYMLPETGESDLRDYKFFCFHGEPKVCIAISNRSTHHTECVYDMDWNMQNLEFGVYDGGSGAEKPQCFDDMVRIVRKLCEGFAHVRIDLYQTNNRVYFGEMTFTAGSGLCKFNPDSIDYLWGSWWDITKPQIDRSIVILDT